MAGKHVAGTAPVTQSTSYRGWMQAPAVGAPDKEWDEYYWECEQQHDANR